MPGDRRDPRPRARARCPSRQARCARGRSRDSARRRRSSARRHASRSIAAHRGRCGGRGYDPSMSFRFSFGRPPAVAANAMVATSQQLATRAGLRILERGGNAADAAIAAAAVLSVTEPMSTGIGGDCFALVWRGGAVEGLDSAGPAPARASPVSPVADAGPRSVTVPGAVAGWAALNERYGRLGLDVCLADAIEAAERGFPIAPRTAEAWARLGSPPGLVPPPRVGEIVRFPELAATLPRIADDGPR